MTRFWYVRNFQREGYRWLSESLARASRSRTTARARCLVGCALLSYDAKAEKPCNEALSICVERGDKWGEAHALRHLGFIAASRGEFVTAKRCYEQALAMFTALRDDRGMAVTFLCLSFAGSDSEGDASHSVRRQHAEQSLKLFRKLENRWGISMTLDSMGYVEPNRERAKAILQQAIAAYPEANGLSEKECQEGAMMAMRRGDIAAERRYLLRHMEIAKDSGNSMGVSFALGIFVLLPELESTRAARLYGAEAALNKTLGINLGQQLDPVREKLIVRIGKARFDACEREGRSLTWEQAVDEAERTN